MLAATRGKSATTHAVPTAPPTNSATMNAGAELGEIPEKVLENMRPIATAGLAKLVDEVNQYAAKM